MIIRYIIELGLETNCELFKAINFVLFHFYLSELETDSYKW